MAATGTAPVDRASVVSTISDAEGYIVSICFKTGPPRLVGVELEFLVHDQADPRAVIEPARLRRALGNHAPTTLTPDSSTLPLSRGGVVTVEPGGQVEISTPPYSSLARLAADTAADLLQLQGLLAAEGLTTRHDAIDPLRTPHLMLDTPRYRAMARNFNHAGPEGFTMMCSTASLQVSIDVGAPDRIAARWAAAHAVGPVLLAAFAAGGRHPAMDSGWASPRMRTWLSIDQARTRPAFCSETSDPTRDWAQYSLDAPLLCRRRAGEDWSVPRGLTFADWIRHPEPFPPTFGDLEYHLSTLFPPVRPRGYLELRYLDAQPAGQWLAPAALLAGLNTDDALLDEAAEICAPVRDRWHEAAQWGLADRPLGAAALALRDVATRAVGRTDLSPAQIDAVVERLERCLQPRSLR
ncbi:MAG TPA: ergothioneine biosynthesis glutamate--cysteine ligase EgtA [Propionibacteriaceae bacterium]|nr:ergothioneine biosynthesis glutamate--cysteine ligase EgtA [Propionibacteriaceae bacterium]